MANQYNGSYDAVHNHVKRVRGRAAGHPCFQCGEVAHDWAYQYNGEPEIYSSFGRAYAEDIWGCYEAMCQSCHQAFDISRDPRYAAIMTDVGKRLGALTAERWENDDGRMRNIASASLSRVNEEIRICDDCSMFSTPSGMSRHLKAKGHSGYH